MAHIEEAVAVAVGVLEVEHGCLFGGRQFGQGVPGKGADLAAHKGRKGALLVDALDHEQLGALLLQVHLDAVLSDEAACYVESCLFPHLQHAAFAGRKNLRLLSASSVT